MSTNIWFEFDIPPVVTTGPVSIRLGDFGDRWMAAVRTGATTSEGLGASAREALVAALAPFGQRASMALMAEPVMFGASADLLARAAV